MFIEDAEDNGSPGSVLNWLTNNSSIGDYRTTNDHSTTSSVSAVDSSLVNDVNIKAGVQAIMQVLPDIIKAVSSNETLRESFEDIVGSYVEDADVDNAEAWPAIIGAIASALPSIIGAVSTVVNKDKRRNKSRNQSVNSAGAQNTNQVKPQAVVDSSPSQHNDANCSQQTSENSDNDSEAMQSNSNLDEAVSMAVILPVIIQLLPVIIPLINQVIVPLLTKGLPKLLSGLNKKSASAKKESVNENQFNESGAWQTLTEGQVDSLWEESSFEDFSTESEERAWEKDSLDQKIVDVTS